jgi:hypothetical protein
MAGTFAAKDPVDRAVRVHPHGWWLAIGECGLQMRPARLDPPDPAPPQPAPPPPDPPKPNAGGSPSVVLGEWWRCQRVPGAKVTAAHEKAARQPALRAGPPRQPRPCTPRGPPRPRPAHLGCTTRDPCYKRLRPPSPCAKLHYRGIGLHTCTSYAAGMFGMFLRRVESHCLCAGRPLREFNLKCLYL